MPGERPSIGERVSKFFGKKDKPAAPPAQGAAPDAAPPAPPVMPPEVVKEKEKVLADEAELTGIAPDLSQAVAGDAAPEAALPPATDEELKAILTSPENGGEEISGSEDDQFSMTLNQMSPFGRGDLTKEVIKGLSPTKSEVVPVEPIVNDIGSMAAEPVLEAKPVEAAAPAGPALNEFGRPEFVSDPNKKLWDEDYALVTASETDPDTPLEDVKLSPLAKLIDSFRRKKTESATESPVAKERPSTILAAIRKQKNLARAALMIVLMGVTSQIADHTDVSKSMSSVPERGPSAGTVAQPDQTGPGYEPIPNNGFTPPPAPGEGDNASDPNASGDGGMGDPDGAATDNGSGTGDGKTEAGVKGTGGAQAENAGTATAQPDSTVANDDASLLGDPHLTNFRFTDLQEAGPQAAGNVATEIVSGFLGDPSKNTDNANLTDDQKDHATNQIRKMIIDGGYSNPDGSVTDNAKLRMFDSKGSMRKVLKDMGVGGQASSGDLHLDGLPAPTMPHIGDMSADQGYHAGVDPALEMPMIGQITIDQPSVPPLQHDAQSPAAPDLASPLPDNQASPIVPGIVTAAPDTQTNPGLPDNGIEPANGIIIPDNGVPVGAANSPEANLADIAALPDSSVSSRHFSDLKPGMPSMAPDVTLDAAEDRDGNVTDAPVLGGQTTQKVVPHPEVKLPEIVTVSAKAGEIPKDQMGLDETAADFSTNIMNGTERAATYAEKQAGSADTIREYTVNQGDFPRGAQREMGMESPVKDFKFSTKVMKKADLDKAGVKMRDWNPKKNADISESIQIESKSDQELSEDVGNAVAREMNLPPVPVKAEVKPEANNVDAPKPLADVFTVKTEKEAYKSLRNASKITPKNPDSKPVDLMIEDAKTRLAGLHSELNIGRIDLGWLQDKLIKIWQDEGIGAIAKIANTKPDELRKRHPELMPSEETKPVIKKGERPNIGTVSPDGRWVVVRLTNLLHHDVKWAPVLSKVEAINALNAYCQELNKIQSESEQKPVIGSSQNSSADYKDNLGLVNPPLKSELSNGQMDAVIGDQTPISKKSPLDEIDPAHQ